jgi:hypothetical protein
VLQEDNRCHLETARFKAFKRTMWTFQKDNLGHFKRTQVSPEQEESKKKTEQEEQKEEEICEQASKEEQSISDTANQPTPTSQPTEVVHDPLLGRMTLVGASTAAGWWDSPPTPTSQDKKNGDARGRSFADIEAEELDLEDAEATRSLGDYVEELLAA